MSIPTSTAPAVKAALLATIATQVNDPAVLVSYDEEGRNQPADIITVGDVHRQVLTLAQVGDLGAGALYEKYTIDIEVSSYRGGNDAQAVEERAYTLLAAVEAAVRSDPTVGGLVLEAVPRSTDSHTSWEQDPENSGYLTVIPVPVAVTAVI